MPASAPLRRALRVEVGSSRAAEAGTGMAAAGTAAVGAIMAIAPASALRPVSQPEARSDTGMAAAIMMTATMPTTAITAIPTPITMAITTTAIPGTSYRATTIPAPAPSATGRTIRRQALISGMTASVIPVRKS